MKELGFKFSKFIHSPKGVITEATAAIGLLYAATACGDGGSADNPTQTDTEPSPSNTLVMTATPGETPEVTPIPPTEAPKLYGPAPTVDDLKSRVTVAFGGNVPLGTDIERDVMGCLGQFHTAKYEAAKTESNARAVLGKCQDLAQQLKNQVGDSVALEAALNGLRDAYYGGVEIFVGMGLIPASDLEPSRVESTIETYFSAK